eukprot:scpid108718/ scgid27657/ 
MALRLRPAVTAHGTSSGMMISSADWMPVQLYLDFDASFHEVGESLNDETFALSFFVVVVGVTFRKHGDARGGGTSHLPSSTLCVGNPADTVCSELQPCHFTLHHSPLLFVNDLSILLLIQQPRRALKYCNIHDPYIPAARPISSTAT